MQLKEAISRDIVEGRRAPGSKLPTTVDLAREYGVCHKTVQLAMKALTREKLLTRRPRHGTFVAHIRKENLIEFNGQRRVALLMPYLAEGFRASQFVKELIDGAMLAAEECGCRVEFSVYSNFQSLTIDPWMSGLLLLRPERDEALRLKRFGLPTILLDRSYPRLGLGFVQTDNVHGITLAVRHLVSLGHRRILYVHNHRPLDPTFSAEDRHRGFRRAAKRFGLPTETYSVLVDDLVKRLDRLDFTAILTDGYGATTDTLSALRAGSIRFPDDVSLVGFDEVELAEHMSAPLTVVRQNLDQVGATGLRHLLDGDVDWRRVKTLIRPELIVRGSTRAVALG